MGSRTAVVTLTALAVVAAMGAGVAAQPRPVIERLEPTSGPPGTKVQIIGRYMPRDSELLLGETKLPVMRRLPNRWTVRIPEGAETAHLIIDTGRGKFRGPRFRVTEPPPPPEITAMEPTKGPPGTEVTIEGDHFSARSSENEVTLGSKPVVVRSATPTSLRVIVPDGAESSPFQVRVTHAGAAKTDEFEVTQGTAITELDPPQGPPGSTLTIRGSGFSPRGIRNRVFLGNRRLRVIEADEDELKVRLPRRGISSGRILVDVRGSGRAETTEDFELQERPKVQGFEPARVAQGKQVTIEGAHFGEDLRDVKVTMGGAELPIRGIRPDRIEVEVPEGASAGQITVRVHELEASSRRSLDVLEPLKVTGFEPTSGPMGTVVTVRGQGFASRPGEHEIMIQGTEADVQSVREGELRVKIPEGARSGPLQIHLDGSGTVKTDKPFVVTEPPRIARFSPRSGGPGTEVSLRGRHFGDRKGLVQVELAGRPMKVRKVSETRIVAIVPEGASSGRITVTVRMQGRDTTNHPFRVK